MKIERSFRKTISLTVKSGEVVVKSPFFVSKKNIELFVEKNKHWIEKKIEQDTNKVILTDKEIILLIKRAKIYIPSRVSEIASLYNLSYNNIKITSAKTRWGSCTNKRNLNFSYRLMRIPEDVIDYVIVHELAHLIHMNHSKSFWDQVEKMMPEYKKHEKWLKDNGNLIT